MEALKKLLGIVFLYGILVLTLMFILEKQPSSFIYVSF